VFRLCSSVALAARCSVAVRVPALRGGGLHRRLSSHRHRRVYRLTIPTTNTTAGSSTNMTELTLDVLKKQNAETSAAVIHLLENDADFQKLAQYEGDLTVARDNEDAEKLQKGIDFAKAKGVIDPDYKPEPYLPIDVLGKSPDQVADEILEKLGDGTVLVLVGLSGTGKGTTVAKLRQKLEASDKSVVTWSNGNIFRSVTLLAATWCEQQNEGGGGEFDKDKALTKDNIGTFMNMLEFGKNAAGQFDTHIVGLGLDVWVSEVENTELKAPKVSKNIPTVAEFTQVRMIHGSFIFPMPRQAHSHTFVSFFSAKGEVILFAAEAAKQMGEAGLVVLLEGREQTVNYVRTPHRFTLVLSDESLIGKRRAAQRLMGAVVATESDDQIEAALRESLKDMVKEIQ
jgi:hypothetical protein